jgi:hypothetical protein
MEKQEALELLGNAMGSLSAEAEIEAQIAENAGISREEYNRIIGNDEEIPDCIKKYREINRKRKYYEGKLLNAEITDQLLQDAEKQDTCLPVIQSMIEAGMLKREKNKDGKYEPNDGHNDKSIIKWIFNYSGYEDEITSEIYYQYVATNNKASTIDRYFSDTRNETPEKKKSV